MSLAQERGEAYADALVLYCLRHHSLWRNTVHEHLKTCDEAAVLRANGEDGEYGCATGCEFARLTATVTCPHIPDVFDFEYGEFGTIADLMDEFNRYGNVP